MSWLMRTVLGLALAFGAGAALAGCPGPCGQGGGYGGGYAYDGGGYGHDRGGPPPGYGGPDRYSGYSLRTYGDVAQHYGYLTCGRCAAFAHERAYDERYGERGPSPCQARGCGDCRQCGELIIGGAFTYDYGVGPYPEGGYGGGGGGYVSGGGFAGAGAGAAASASARASAYASSSSQVSVNIGGRGGHKGGCGTCGGGYKGGGHR